MSNNISEVSPPRIMPDYRELLEHFDHATFFGRVRETFGTKVRGPEGEKALAEVLEPVLNSNGKVDHRATADKLEYFKRIYQTLQWVPDKIAAGVTVPLGAGAVIGARCAGPLGAAIGLVVGSPVAALGSLVGVGQDFLAESRPASRAANKLGSLAQLHRKLGATQPSE